MIVSKKHLEKMDFCCGNSREHFLKIFSLSMEKSFQVMIWPFVMSIMFLSLPLFHALRVNKQLEMWRSDPPPPFCGRCKEKEDVSRGQF